MCKEAGCEKKVHAKGLCQAHYRLLKKYDTTEKLPKELYKRPGPAPKPKSPRAIRAKKLRESCPYGHALDEQNTYLYKGSRICRTCNRERMRIRRPKTVGQGGHNKAKTHCPQNHEYTEENTIWSKDGRRSCRECARANGRVQVIKKYGISVEQFESLIKNQDNKCLLCLDSFDEVPSAIDHDHQCCPGVTSCGNCIRGILCKNCNTILGLAKDNPEVLLRAVAYLRDKIKND